MPMHNEVSFFVSNVATLMIPIDTTLTNILTEVILCCDDRGMIVYANASAQQWSDVPLDGQPFLSILHSDVAQKGNHFFAAARNAFPEEPTTIWELALGSLSNYVPIKFRGFAQDSFVILIGEPESPEENAIHQEMLELTSELSEAQRELRRQNKSLQKLLHEQQQLLHTIQELTAPAVPIWQGVLLLPLVGHIDNQRAEKIAEELLERVNTIQATYVIFDMSGIVLVDDAVAQHIIDLSRSVRLLGANPIMVGINPMIAETMVHTGLELQEFIIHTDLQHAVAYVLRKLQYKD